MITTETMVTRQAVVDRSRTPENALFAAIGGKRLLASDRSVIYTIRSGSRGIEKVEVVFFLIDCPISGERLVQEYRERRIQPDPYAVLAVNETNPYFADQHHNSVIWQACGGQTPGREEDLDQPMSRDTPEAEGRWCYASFDFESVIVCSAKGDWGPGWWFGGVRIKDAGASP